MENKSEYTVEMMIGGFWEAPRTIFASTPEAARAQARRMIKRFKAERTKVWGSIGNSWMTVDRFIGRSLTLHRF